MPLKHAKDPYGHWREMKKKYFYTFTLLTIHVSNERHLTQMLYFMKYFELNSNSRSSSLVCFHAALDFGHNVFFSADQTGQDAVGRTPTRLETITTRRHDKPGAVRMQKTQAKGFCLPKVFLRQIIRGHPHPSFQLLPCYFGLLCHVCPCLVLLISFWWILLPVFFFFFLVLVVLPFWLFSRLCFLDLSVLVLTMACLLTILCPKNPFSSRSRLVRLL